MKTPLNRRQWLYQTTLGTLFAGEISSMQNVHANEPQPTSKPTRLFAFLGGKKGEWQVLSQKTIVGEALLPVERLQIQTDQPNGQAFQATWVLRGITSNDRYVNREEKTTLQHKQSPLGRADAKYAAVIPIRKNPKWWLLTQDERRQIFEEQSKHITIGLKYLPAIARRLHHCRDLSTKEPFDFITLFDFNKKDVSAFDDMLSALRATEEWKYIDREVDIRLEHTV